MNPKLNILMITHKHQLGSEARSLSMAKQLVRMGHAVSIMLISRNRRFGIREYEFEGIHAIETPDLLWGRFRTGWDPWNMLNRIFYLLFKSHSYDLIHCFETRPVTIYPALVCARKERIPLLTDWNDWWGHNGLVEVNRPNWYRHTFLRHVETFYEEAFRVKSAGITVITSALKQRAIALGANAKNICIIPGGAPGGGFSEYYIHKSKQECRSLSGMNGYNPILGFVSADTHLDMEVILGALEIVARKYPKVKMFITGKVKPSVHQLIAQHGVENRIIYTGFLSAEEYPVYLGCADLFLLPMADRPYNHGRWPNKMGDYLFIGRPTIANPIGDIKPLFDTHRVGLLAEWSAEDFASKIIYLLDNPAISEKMGRCARDVAEKKFDWSILAKNLEAFYFKILEQKVSDHEGDTKISIPISILEKERGEK